MTDADRQSLNKRIALRLGYTYENGLWNAPEGEPLYGLKDLPDFTREWKHAGPLLVKIALTRPEIEIRAPNPKDEPWCLIMGLTFKGNTLIEAIALAYDAWEEGKE